MDVDDGRGVLGDKAGGEDLHVAGEDDQFNVERLKEADLLGFRLDAGGGGDRDVFNANVVEGRQGLDIAMIGDDDSDFTSQFAGAGAIKQVSDAVQILRAEEGYAWTLTDAAELPVHREIGGHRGESLNKLNEAFFREERPLDAHEEETKGVILVLISVEDVGVLLVEEARDAGDQAFLVGAINEEHGTVLCRLQRFAGRTFDGSHRLQIT